MKDFDGYPKASALQFNECINNQNVQGLAELMTDDHLFIDSVNDSIAGKKNNIENWRKFFTLFPDYQNVFEKVTVKGNTVIMEGYSTCSHEILSNKKSIWTAEIKGEKLKEWRVYTDTAENRKRLGLL